jgi:hypothetical protein
MCPIVKGGSRRKSTGVVTKLWRISIICGKYRKNRRKTEDNTHHRDAETQRTRNTEQDLWAELGSDRNSLRKTRRESLRASFVFLCDSVSLW